MGHLNENDIKEIKEKLLVEKSKIETELSRFAIKDKEIDGNYKAKYDDLGDSEEDNAQEYAEQERKLSLEHTLEKSLKDINNALSRVKEDGYGICKYCKKPIKKERLLARPESSSCIECKTVLSGS